MLNAAENQDTLTIIGFFQSFQMLENDVVKLLFHCDINAMDVETEVPPELHRVFADQVNLGCEGSMEVPHKSLATSTNKPCCHFDSAESQGGSQK